MYEQDPQNESVDKKVSDITNKAVKGFIWLPPALRERETPSQRLPLTELIFSSAFGHTERLDHRQDEEDHL